MTKAPDQRGPVVRLTSTALRVTASHDLFMSHLEPTSLQSVDRRQTDSH
jgi:hypothetical protein